MGQMQPMKKLSGSQCFSDIINKALLFWTLSRLHILQTQGFQNWISVSVLKYKTKVGRGEVPPQLGHCEEASFHPWATKELLTILLMTNVIYGR
jgi:hypothetical protein